MMADGLEEFELLTLRQLAADASPAPWVSYVEGRDHDSGDNFIQVNDGDDADMYVFRDTTPASAADQDFIAAARNLVPKLLDELDRLRAL
jgi:hypothetical protein